ncbi:hypothetical protein M9H77_21693 [Catharanthus roseus]|uniref:Uncharacterized protein n=1 Tax=Catharanthus roseus TaxID=4058 RepID=A0ACC0APT2_CATRO|nr:hypothetical protein M9H77_21693 [Catharanthus roseus]
MDYVDVFGSVKELHSTWLVPRTKASSNGVDDLDSGEWIHLKSGVDCGGYSTMGLCGQRIMLCGGVRPPSEESGGLDTEVGPRADLIDQLRTNRVLLRDWALVFGTYSLVPRGTQILYSAAVDLVVGLGISQNQYKP